MVSVHLFVNGKEHLVEIDPEMPLLWALRDILDLTGTKYSCGIGECGSCSVLIEGEAVRSCIIPASSAEGKEIITIEGLSPDKDHPLQQAWIEENVSQCGYCQSGQIINAAALLKRTPNPTKDEINSAMANVLCRCGTYQRIRNAILLAAGKGGSSW
jgi:isoquinoline 1-oxidoreductase alpha subunit